MAQTIPCPEALDHRGYDDGSAETAWGLSSPAATGDWFEVDFGVDLAGETVLGLSISTLETGSGGGVGRFGLYPINPATGAPDLANPLTEVANPTGLPGPGPFCTVTTFDLPDITVPAGTQTTVCFHLPTGDTVTWLCTDNNGARAGRSYFSTNSFATPAIPFTVNWMMRAAVSSPVGTFTVNAQTATTVRQLDTVALTFWGNAPNEQYLQFLQVGTSLVGPLPAVVLTTGTGGIGPTIGNLCGPLPCAAPAGQTFNFLAVYADLLDLNPRGNPRIKLTNPASLTVGASAVCNPTLCFGQKDDGVLDGNVWKVNNPSGALDYFNVALGNAPAGVGTLIGLDAASWDFCGNGPCWASIGVYGAGATPVSNPISVIGGASACVPPGVANWGYPAVFYDFPDVPATTTTFYEIAAHWQTGDSCLWMASDTDAADAGSACSSIPSTSSFFTVDGYATPAILMSAANWMMKLDWN